MITLGRHAQPGSMHMSACGTHVVCMHGVGTRQLWSVQRSLPLPLFPTILLRWWWRFPLCGCCDGYSGQRCSPTLRALVCTRCWHTPSSGLCGLSFPVLFCSFKLKLLLRWYWHPPAVVLLPMLSVRCRLWSDMSVLSVLCQAWCLTCQRFLCVAWCLLSMLSVHSMVHSRRTYVIVFSCIVVARHIRTPPCCLSDSLSCWSLVCHAPSLICYLHEKQGPEQCFVCQDHFGLL
mmetsp:Transcript_19136/g.53580  ORF Transcript_19136/g.53580 Transcript_19136/m.53580 type:complete len:233 (+) Transcript_19136:1264-1962(+)